MAKEVFIPKLGQTVEEVRIVRWLVPDGTNVEQGQEIMEVETDKAVFPVEAGARGTLHIGPYGEDDTLPVLTIVGIIGKPDESFAQYTGKATQAAPSLAGVSPGPATPESEASPSEAGVPSSGKVFASPRARKLAEETHVPLAQVTPTGGGGQRVAERDVQAYLSQAPRATPVAHKMAAEAGVDLQAVAGTGRGGRVMKEDIAQAVKSAAVADRPLLAARDAPGGPDTQPAVPAAPAKQQLPPQEVVERVPLKGVRSIIAERMAASVHTTARVTLMMEVDATEFVTMRERLKARVAETWGFAPGFNDLLAKIVAMALRKHPYMNTRLAPDAIEVLSHVNLGMAVDTERGLLVPVIRDVDQKSLRQFGAEFRELADRARRGRSLPDDLTGGTFTITNLGSNDVLAFTPVINLPEAAILGVGCITPRPVVRADQVVVRQMLILSLVFDHRLVDGAPAARFLQTIKELVEEPYLWVTG